MKYLDGVDFFVRLIPLPSGVNGLVSPNDDGTFSVYLNSKATDDQQRKSYRHELRHIENDDFSNGKSIVEIERL